MQVAVGQPRCRWQCPSFSSAPLAPPPHWASTRSSRAAPTTSTALGASTTLDVDVCVVGAGIIGLLVTRQLMQSSPDASVALLDAKQPCAGATGAGQGYIWMSHRDPASPGWALAQQSKAMWQQLAAGGGQQASPALLSALEWQANGSLLLATTDAEVQQLAARAVMLQQQGVKGVVLLSPRELAMLEPALVLPPGSRGLLVKSDAQINGKQTAFALLEECTRLAASSSSSRLTVGLQEGVTHIQPQGGGSVEVVTQHRRVRARRGVVVAAGVWSGQLLADATGQPAWQQLLQPRRGHLLEMQPPTGMPPVHTGMMELSYTAHYSSSSSPGHAQAAGGGGGVDITFTATTSAAGTLLIGSSREFSGWGAAPSSDIINAIMRRAATFLPNLAGITSEQLLGSTRVGLRPYAVGGLPAVGPVGSALPGVYVAAGHEGSGLCLGPATAELALHHLLGSEVAPGASQQQRDALLAAAAALMPEQRLLAAAAAVGRGVDK